MQTMAAIRPGGLLFFRAIAQFWRLSRYGKSMQQVKKGNFWGLPFNFIFFSLITVITVSGTYSLFGKMVTDPLETVSHELDNTFAVVLGLLTVLTATIGINIVAELCFGRFRFFPISPPQKLSFSQWWHDRGSRVGRHSPHGTPFNSPELIHYTPWMYWLHSLVHCLVF